MRRRISAFILALAMVLGAVAVPAYASGTYTVLNAYEDFVAESPEFVNTLFEYSDELGEGKVVDFLVGIQNILYNTNRFSYAITEANFEEALVNAVNTLIYADDYIAIQKALVSAWPKSIKEMNETHKVTEEFMPLYNAVNSMIFDHDMLVKRDSGYGTVVDITEIDMPGEVSIDRGDVLSLPTHINVVSVYGTKARIRVDWYSAPDTMSEGSWEALGRLLVPDGFKMGTGLSDEISLCVEINNPYGGDELPKYQCGDNLYYTLSSAGKLTITGRGEMWPWVFSNNTNITSVEVKNGAANIGKGAFSGCRYLKTVTLPASVKNIADSAFEGCSRLVKVSFPSSLKTIGDRAFEGCSALSGVTIPSGVTSIGRNAFAYCTSITAISIPSSVEKIDSYTFYCCSELTSVYIPDSVKTIGYSAFEYCRNLTYVTLPSELETLESYAFFGCYGIMEIVIPKTLTAVGYQTFSSCRNLRRVIVEDGMTDIPAYMFYYWTNPVSIELPDSVKTIGRYAFYNCDGLEALELPANLESIGNYAFSESANITSLTLPKTLNEVGSYAFYNCEKLTEITLEEGTERVLASEFSSCKTLKTMNLPESVKAIGSSAFYGCNDLEKIDLSNVTELGEYAFFACNSLTAIELPSEMKTIPESAFRSSKGLTEVSIPEGVEKIEKNAFYECAALRSVTIPASVTSIGTNAFRNCTNVILYVYPESYAVSYAEANSIPYEYVFERNDLILSVLGSDGTELTDGFSVVWFKQDSENIIANGTHIQGFNKNEAYEYTVFLGEELSQRYIEPAKQSVHFPEETENPYKLSITLEAYPEIVVKGILSNAEGQPIEGATVVSEQNVNVKHSRRNEAITDASGAYELVLAKEAASLKFTAFGYYDRSIDLTELALSEETELDLGIVALSPMPSDKITLSLSMKTAAAEGEEGYTQSITSFDGLTFELFNVTQERPVIEFTAQYPNIVISDEDVQGGDVISIAIEDTNEKMTANPVEIQLSELKVGSGEVGFVENGRIKIAALNGSGKYTAMLFNGEGSFIAAYDAETSFESNALPDGEYKVVLIEETSLMRSIAEVSKLGELGLVEGEDYAMAEAQVFCGYITVIDEVSVPELDESKLYYTVDKNTNFTANVTTATVGHYIVMRAEYEISPEYQTSDEYLTFAIPENVSFVDGSLMLNGKRGEYTEEGREIKIMTNASSGVARFYVVPTETGTYDLNAYLGFKLDGTDILQPIGTVSFEAKADKINVPARTSKKTVTVTGTALSESEVVLYSNGKVVGEAKANKNGNWTVAYNLGNPRSYSYHEIYAEISNANYDKSVRTASSFLRYDKSQIELAKITMINRGDNGENVSVFDFINPGKTPSYRMWPGVYKTFTFKVEIDGGTDDTIEDVYVVTTNTSGAKTYIPVYYNSATDMWLGSWEFTKFAQAPVKINAIYNEKGVNMIDSEAIEGTVAAVEAIEVDGNGYNDIYAAMLADGMTADEIDAVKYDSAELSAQILDGSGYTYSFDEETGVITLCDGDQSFELKNSTAEGLSEHGLLSSGFTSTLTSGDYRIFNKTEGSFAWYADLQHDVFQSVGATVIGSSVASDISKARTTIVEADANHQLRTAMTSASRDLAAFETYAYGYDEKLAFIYDETIKLRNTAFAEWQSGSEAQKEVLKTEVIKLAKQANDIARLRSVFAEINFLGVTRTAAGLIQSGNTIMEIYDEVAKLEYDYPIYKGSLDRIESELDVVSTRLLNYYGIDFGADISNVLALTGGTDIILGERLSAAVSAAATRIYTAQIFNDDISEKLDEIRLSIDELEGKSVAVVKPQALKPDQSAKPILDPSGYVYEAVPSNRVEGVKVEAYIYDYPVDEFGVPMDTKAEILWDAEEYDQVNPLYTDANGQYAWDVPNGQWLIKFSKDGYYDTDSRSNPAADDEGYLPVPPPQTEVNTAIVSKAAPTVAGVNAYNTGIQIIFSQYMKLDSVNETNVTFSIDGNPVDGRITPVNAEYNYEQTEQFASIFNFAPATEISGSVDISVKAVVNYAGTEIEADYIEQKPITMKPTGLSVPDGIEIETDKQQSFEVQVLPAEAGNALVLDIVSASPSIVAAETATVITDENGKATVTLNGLLPGNSEITVSIADTDISATFTANVKIETPDPIESCAKAEADIASGSLVEKGTKVTLSTATEGATIYYTIGAAADAERKEYTEPIEITKDTLITAYVAKEGFADSAISTFRYGVYGISLEKLTNTIIINSSKSMTGVSVIVALYKDGEQLSVETKSADLNVGANTVISPVQDYSSADTVKIMVWETTDSLKPLFEVYAE